MEKDSKNYILDTSAFISLESIGVLNKVLQVFSITTTNSAIKELEELRDLRNWKDNIIYLTIKNQLESI